MSSSTKARLLGLLWGAGGGFVISAADALADVLKGAPVPPLAHILTVGVAGAFVGAALFLRQPPRDVWTPEQRRSQTGQMPAVNPDRREG